jgi:hypothetical protein
MRPAIGPVAQIKQTARREEDLLSWPPSAHWQFSISLQKRNVLFSLLGLVRIRAAFCPPPHRALALFEAFRRRPFQGPLQPRLAMNLGSPTLEYQTGHMIY